MTNRAPVQLYEQLMVRLHSELRDGRGGSASADALRDEMDVPWAQLSTDEHGALDLLSEDLYEVSGKRRAVLLAPGDTSKSVLDGAGTALRRRDYRRTLELLRKADPQALPTDVRFCMLGRCWDELGFSLAATEFFDRAYGIGKRANYAVMALNTLVRAGQRDEVLARIAKIEADPKAAAALRLRAAGCLFETAEGATPPDTTGIFLRVINLVEPSLDAPDVVPSLRATALIAEGFSYEHMGENTKALQAFDKAVNIHEHDSALIARAFSQLATNRPAALADFQRALNLGTSLPWPYLYLAHDALLAGRYDRLEELCTEGLQRSRRHRVRAQFYEWAAIAAAQLGRVPSIVGERFARAMAEDPFEARIQANAAAWEAAVQEAAKKKQAKVTSPSPWDYARQLDDESARKSLSRRATKALAAAA
ncbi:MAG: tetratricopeptide repeat protein [Polyangiaceae bacterium]